MGNVTVDFVAREADQSRWQMLLVEEGPWPEGQIEANLQRIQERLYGCIEAAMDGQLAEKYPASVGKALTILVDFYNVPEKRARQFFERFSTGALDQPTFRTALEGNGFVQDISFEANFQ